MKKLILLTICTLSVFIVQAQNNDFKINTALSLNYTLTGDVLNNAVEDTESTAGESKKRGFPSIQASVDYSIRNWFSLGLAGSYQNIGYDFSDNTFINESGQTVTEDFSIDFSRVTIALRPLFHYGNIENLDMYSGLRIQYFNRNFKSTSLDAATKENFEDFTNTNRLSVGVVLYGLRYYITDNIGLGTEINLGRPYLLNFSVNARF